MEQTLWTDYNIYYNILCFLITENEKLFDKSDAKLYWTTVIHIFATLHHYYVSLFSANINLDYTEILHKLSYSEYVDLDNLYRYKFAYLTGWSFLFQTVFLSLSLLYDLLEWLDKHQSDFGKKLQFYRDVIFSGLVVPFTLFISTMFWTVYTIDRELVFPTVYDQIVPWWFNHCVHTNITVVVVVETLLQARRYPAHRTLELGLVTLINLGYAVVYYSIFFITDRWLYGVFGIMTWWQVCLYQLLIWGSAFIFYFLQFPINRIFHREEIVEEQKSTELAKTANGDTNGDPTFPAKSWSLKYKSVGSENSKL